MDEQVQPTIRITLDDTVAQGEYINFANIIHSPSEFVIDLGRIVPGRQDVKVYSRVIMTPLHAKQLLEALAQNISIFEQKFGEIRIDGASVVLLERTVELIRGARQDHRRRPGRIGMRIRPGAPRTSGRSLRDAAVEDRRPRIRRRISRSWSARTPSARPRSRMPSAC